MLFVLRLNFHVIHTWEKCSCSGRRGVLRADPESLINLETKHWISEMEYFELQWESSASMFCKCFECQITSLLVFCLEMSDAFWTNSFSWLFISRNMFAFAFIVIVLNKMKCSLLLPVSDSSKCTSFSLACTFSVVAVPLTKKNWKQKILCLSLWSFLSDVHFVYFPSVCVKN